MTHNLKPYPAMKDSGVPWLGEVPEHWELRRLKTVCSMRSGDGITAMSIEPAGDYPVYGGNGVRGYTSSYTHDGDFALIGRQGALCGNVHLARGRFWASEHAVVASLRSGHVLEWFGAILLVMNLNQYSIAAAQPGLAVERVLNLWLPVPPAQEQAAIVRFLGHADRRIRRLISAKLKLIKLLEEQKQAIIHRAVTRGLDPNVRLKPSGVEWLGDVPEHWEVSRVRHWGRIVGGMTPSMSDRSYWGGDIPWVTPKDMKRAVIDDSQMRVTEAATEHTSLRKLPAGAVLLVVRGMILARRVPIARTSASVTINQDMKAILPRADVEPAYLAYTLGSAQAVLAPLIDEAGHGTKRLPTERWRELTLPLPAQGEQAAIVNYLESATADLAATIERAHREISLLREYRTRLVADAVTGKLDVREAAAALPDLAEEPEPLDEADALDEGDDDEMEEPGDAEA